MVGVQMIINKRIIIVCVFSTTLLFSCDRSSPTGPETSDPDPTPPPTEENRPPKITSTPPTEVDEHGTYDYRIKAEDPDGDKVTFSLVKAPDWLDFYSTLNSIYGTAPGVKEDTDFSITIRASDGEDHDEQSYDLTVKNLYNVHTVSGNKISSVEDDRVTFSEPVDFEEGDIIIPDIDEGDMSFKRKTQSVLGFQGWPGCDYSPSGFFLRKITGWIDDGITALTEPATLEEAIENESFAADGKGIIPTNYQYRGHDGVSIEPSREGFGFNLEFEDILLFGERNSSFNLIADGKIYANTDFTFRGDVEGIRLKKLYLHNKITGGADITLTSGLAYPTNRTIEKDLFSCTLPTLKFITPSGIPIYLTPQFDFGLTIPHGEIPTLKANVSQEVTLGLGLSYNGNSWENLSGFENEFNYSLLAPKEESDLEAYVGPRLTFFLYNAIGPVVGVNKTLRLDAKSENNWRLYGGLQGFIGVDMGIFSKFVRSPEPFRITPPEKLLDESDEIHDTGKILFTSTRDGNAEIYLMNSDGSNQQNLTNHSAHDSQPAWSPDNNKFIFVSERSETPDIYTMKLDGSDLERLTYPVNSSDPSDGKNINADPHWSPDGTEIVFYSQRDNDEGLWLMNSDGTDLRKLNLPFGVHYYPKWCGGSEKVVFSSTLAGEGALDVYIVNLDGSNLKRLTNNSEPDVFPICNKDGSKIAFTTRKNGYYDIWVMDVNGTNQVNITDNPDIDDYIPAWSPDGSNIIYTSGNIDRSESDIWLMKPDGTGKNQITFREVGSNQHPTWSLK